MNSLAQLFSTCDCYAFQGQMTLSYWLPMNLIRMRKSYGSLHSECTLTRTFSITCENKTLRPALHWFPNVFHNLHLSLSARIQIQFNVAFAWISLPPQLSNSLHCNNYNCIHYQPPLDTKGIWKSPLYPHSISEGVSPQYRLTSPRSWKVKVSIRSAHVTGDL